VAPNEQAQQGNSNANMEEADATTIIPANNPQLEHHSNLNCSRQGTPIAGTDVVHTITQ
jgi:hypothetical protein